MHKKPEESIAAGKNPLEKAALLHVTDYKHPSQLLHVEFWSEEFALVSPEGVGSESGKLFIRYVPDRHLISAHSLERYLLAWRDSTTIPEDAVNRILQDLVAVARPLTMTVEADFSGPGLLGRRVKVAYGEKGRR